LSVSPGEAVARLMSRWINIFAYSDCSIDLASRLVRGAKCFRLTVRGVEEGVESVREIIQKEFV
ncbi:MAG: hypothetical protein HY709_07880, partial [Candidatus Latescibacteria bacterium]|nr:hypothetical protein [Candidatus Latescibacterota bacterium]